MSNPAKSKSLLPRSSSNVGLSESPFEVPHMGSLPGDALACFRVASNLLGFLDWECIRSILRAHGEGDAAFHTKL